MLDIGRMAQAMDVFEEGLDETLASLADAIEEDPDEVVEILRSDRSPGDKFEAISELAGN